MTEHAIHLRRAWETPTGRVDLPTSWEGGSIPIHLRRNFHRPRLDDAKERVVLQVRDVSGLVAVRLNGQDMEYHPGDQVWERPIDKALAASNRLELELEPMTVPTGITWGSIALVIRRGGESVENLA